MHFWEKVIEDITNHEKREGKQESDTDLLGI